MITKLPRWVWAGGATLALIAGLINSVGFLGLTHEAITHLTGTFTLAAIHGAKADFETVAHLSGLIFGFFLGAAVSGYIIRESTLKLGRRYGVVLLFETALLCMSVPLLQSDIFWGGFLASAACGLQNAMASSYSGAVVRTTHLSGMVTDLGITVGHLFRGLPVDIRRVTLYLALIGGFVFGAILGSWLFPHWGYATLYLPATLTGLTGGTYILFVGKWKPSLEK